ncbi:SfnB family sulfur acquisition oxidoreductase [Microcystis flos-aquae FACHB-1344]|jgi:SfnB family sulfur acquisition oxidoreductase|uniref:Dibenzothiophene monooxygenase n=1 Tax=Microcystis flos-aquae FACHB-1344 TaxID=2692899 RepID=A0ABR8I1I9_9CHRO|nr:MULTISPECIES: SfnB family sulfur acquisition oxidoreductase [Microcystis]MBD2624777.1 SfnB family sulfur acquisition oxidoreductase [Microcystis flos-aquae FACHB-1344]MCA2699873.1 SfnB family sulfur acquisition oxidoreductase [Microcystis sp. M179S2]
MTTLVNVETEPTAHLIQDDREAIAVAKELAAEFLHEDSLRDRERRLPVEEVKKFSRSGLWGIIVPKEYGGAGVSYATLAQVIAIIAEADSSLGQIPQNHLYMVEAIRLDGTEEQKRFFFDLVLQGKRFGNAFSEIGTKSVTDVQTKLTRSGDGYVLNGRKYYSAGALLADWIPTIAADENGNTIVAFVERDAEGLTLLDDWTSFGQRTTASGTTILENVLVKPEHVIPHYLAFERATPMGAVAQIIQAAVDVGIAKAALRDTLYFVRNHTRPWVDSNQEKGFEDPLTLYNLGNVILQIHAAEALLRRAGEFIDAAYESGLEEAKVVESSIAVAEAKAIATEASLLATNKLFELAGTKSTLEEFNYDRHWRNARAHTLHDPVRWKYYAIGNYFLNGANPPRHPWL